MTTLKSYQIDTVIHFAAQSHVDNSFGNSIQFTMDNILGTHNLLECCRVYGNIKKFIHISTDEVYGEVDLNHEGCTERSLLNPTNPYAATKAGAEFLVKSYYYSYKLPIIITRGNNVYGPGQYPEKLIPKFITSLLKDQKCTIHGQGESRRNFIYVDDVSEAVETILFYGQIGHTYNIGTSNEYSVLEVFDILSNKLDKSKDLKEFVEDRLFNDYRYSINSESLRSLGWKQQINFDEGLEKTIEWIKNN
jgi:UDP-glucose 4,6-dehydratase